MTIEGKNQLLKYVTGKIGTVCLSDILCTNTAEPLISGDGEIGILYQNAVFGADVK
jgi:hypothetical protein